MNFGRESNSNNSADLRSLENSWRLKLPEHFCSIYTHFALPFLAPCEFFSLEAILNGGGRAYGQVPQFMPFGRAVGESGLFGFYVTPETEQGHWPVLYWNEDEMYFRPVSSTFEAFLRHCILVARYETEDQAANRDDESSILEEQREAGRLLKLNAEIIFGPLPRSDTELYKRLARSDEQDALSLCHLGCVSRSRGDNNRALDFCHRAVEAAPWFGDSSYILADTYREMGNHQRAVQGWWAVVQRLLPLCTRTWEWNLGVNHPEGDVYEVAADALAQHAEYADSHCKGSDLWRVVVNNDPYNSAERETFGDSLLAAGDLAGAEREYLNALSLCCSEHGRQPIRIYNALNELYHRQGRQRDADLSEFDSRLPRPRD